MPKGSRDRFEPTIYLPSTSHPDYIEQLNKYTALHRRRRATGYLALGLSNRRAQYYAGQLEQSKVHSDTQDRYVVDAVTLFSEHVLELTASIEPLRFSSDAERLGAAALRVLANIRSQAIDGNYEERKRGKARMKFVLKGIFPSARGKKKNSVSPIEVQFFYWRELFRLYHIRKELRSHEGTKTQKVKSASKKFELPVGEIREFWGLDENDNPDRQPFTLKDMARERTARHFRIKHHTVSNILSLSL
jgi:hypothetical protein